MAKPIKPDNPGNDQGTFAITFHAVKAEGNSGTTDSTFTITRTGNTKKAASVDYGVTGAQADGAQAEDFAGGALDASS